MLRRRAGPAPGPQVGRHEDRPARGPGRASSATWPRCGRRPARSAQVQGGQYAGYLFPMGPFFALGRRCSGWRRGWCTGCGSGTLLALAAWGVVRLLDALLDRPRGAAARWSRALLFAGQPATSWCSPTARASPARPTPRCRGCCWRSSAGCATRAAGGGRRRFALLVTARGGGVNAAVTGVGAASGPLLLALYESWSAGGRRGAALRGVRAARAAALRLARLGLVDRAGARPGALRHRLPAVHRAGGHDLDHDQPDREPAADGLLDDATSAWATASSSAVLRRRRRRCSRAPVVVGDAARARAGARRLRVDPALALRAVLPRRCCCSGCW